MSRTNFKRSGWKISTAAIFIIRTTSLSHFAQSRFRPRIFDIKPHGTDSRHRKTNYQSDHQHHKQDFHQCETLIARINSISSHIFFLNVAQTRHGWGVHSIYTSYIDWAMGLHYSLVLMPNRHHPDHTHYYKHSM